MSISVNKVLPPTYCCPARLVKLSAQVVTRCLIYEDEQCCHYRWDPVNVWQFEIPQKKKKGRKAPEKTPNQQTALEDATTAYAPQPQWQEIKKFRDWWWDRAALGSVDSVLRGHVTTAAEQYSWSARTEEEDVLFLLLRLCIDTKIELSGVHFEKFSEWCDDLAQVISKLGPFPLNKLFVTHDSLGIQPVLIAIVQQSPNLQVVHMNQWALNNELMSSLGSCCRRLTEFSIPLMKPQVFMSDEALFSCFFGGQSSEEVLNCCHLGEKPKISFPKLRLVDILFWKQTEKFIQMLSLFYPNVRLKSVDVGKVEGNVEQTFLEARSHVTALVIICGLDDIMRGKLEPIIRISPHLKEVRVHINDAFETEFNNSDERFKHKLDIIALKLKDILCNINAFEALALCPYYEMGIARVIVPALKVKGSCVTSLHISHEYSQPVLSTIYQLINLCPHLYYLAISLPMLGKEEEFWEADLHRVTLNPCQTLHTLVIKNIQELDLDPEAEEEINHNYIDITNTILKAATELKVFGISVTLLFGTFFEKLASSASVHTLHLHLVPKMPKNISPQHENGMTISLDDFLLGLIPKFPTLATLSVDQEDAYVDLQVMTMIHRSAINITKWRPEFFQELPSWDTIGLPRASHNFNIPVM
ncbi:hypothetical protein Pmani_028906 [Petrolisthes manimaculis]|uniref:Uncharacterized protein n=1 Tax=Petrolisthes manimaculis TaxID=1843537 RepID=A0AAE1P131_9EUCA|nr:hypothetical protein Pmani_028906 [Petrolisthes manimaculis]